MEQDEGATDQDAPRSARDARRHTSTYVLIALGYALYAFGRLTPQPFHAVNSVRETLAWIASLSEALQFHWALLLVLLIGVRVAVNPDWRPVVAAAPLVAWLVVAPLLHGATERCAPGVTCVARGEGTRITSANLLVGNEARAEDVAEELVDTRSDLLVLQEYSSAWDERLRPRLERAGFVHVQSETREDSFGMAVYAKADVTAAVRRVSLGIGELPQFRVAVEHDDDEFAIYTIHTLPPLSRSYSIDGRHEFGQLLDELAEETEPHVLVGDFNSTRASAQYRALTERGYRDVWEGRGDGRGASWRPATLPKLFPGLALDHVYVRGRVVADNGLRVETHGDFETGTPRLGRAHGSDHRPLTVDVDLVG